MSKKKSKKRGHTPSMAEIRKVGDYVKITPAKPEKLAKVKKSKATVDVNGVEWSKSDVNRMSRFEQEARFKN